MMFVVFVHEVGWRRWPNHLPFQSMKGGECDGGCL